MNNNLIIRIHFKELFFIIYYLFFIFYLNLIIIYFQNHHYYFDFIFILEVVLVGLLVKLHFH